MMSSRNGSGWLVATGQSWKMGVFLALMVVVLAEAAVLIVSVNSQPPNDERGAACGLAIAGTGVLPSAQDDGGADRLADGHRGGGESAPLCAMPISERGGEASRWAMASDAGQAARA